MLLYSGSKTLQKSLPDTSASVLISSILGNRISDARQEQVFHSIGYQFNSDRPTPYWYFLGKIVAQALFEDQTALLLLNYVRVRTREFIGFTTTSWRKASEAVRTTPGVKPPLLNVIEINLKRPQPHKPLEAFWKPARGIITERIRLCKSN